MKNINVTSEKDETVFDFKKLEKVKGWALLFPFSFS
jgi:hypothetical protein